MLECKRIGSLAFSLGQVLENKSIAFLARSGRGMEYAFLTRSGPRIALQSCGIYSKSIIASQLGVLRTLRKIDILGLLCNPRMSIGRIYRFFVIGCCERVVRTKDPS